MCSLRVMPLSTWTELLSSPRSIRVVPDELALSLGWFLMNASAHAIGCKVTFRAAGARMLRRATPKRQGSTRNRVPSRYCELTTTSAKAVYGDSARSAMGEAWCRRLRAILVEPSDAPPRQGFGSLRLGRIHH